MSDKYYCPKCNAPDVGDYYNNVCSKCKEDLDKYNPKHARDCNVITLGTVVADIAELIQAEADQDDIIECIDTNFLWGAWGHIIGREDRFLAADLRGIIVAMYQKGLEDGSKDLP